MNNQAVKALHSPETGSTRVWRPDAPKGDWLSVSITRVVRDSVLVGFTIVSVLA